MSSVFRRDGATKISPSEGTNAAELAKFFIDKVDGVRAATENAPPPSYSSFSGPQLNNFHDLNIDDVRKIILGSPIKTSNLDPLPTSVLREMIDVLLPFMWTMCRASPRLCSCVASNWLRLNAEKTQFIWVGSSQMLLKTNKAPLHTPA